MKKKNKGFTLIELLAVIVILGIILTIVVSNVVKYIGKAREGAFKDTYAKVLKDVSNKIALNDLGGDTEEVECKNPTECAAAYDVPAENIALSVYSMGDDEYGVRMTGKGNYASISLSSTNCTNNAKCEGQSMSSTVNSDGEVSPSEISIAKGSDFNKVIIGSVPEVEEIETVKISNTLSYIKYKKTNGDEEGKFYNYNGNVLNSFVLINENEETINEFFNYYNFFEELVNKRIKYADFKEYLSGKGYEKVEDSEYIDNFGDYCVMKKGDMYTDDNYVDYMVHNSNAYYFFSVPNLIKTQGTLTLRSDEERICTYSSTRSKNRGNFSCRLLK